MKKAEQKIKSVLVVIECIILGIGALISESGTSRAVKYSKDYMPYYLYALLGVVLIVILVALQKKQFTIYLGIVMICLYALFAGFHGYGVCALAAERMHHLEKYKDASVIMHVGDDVYAWNGESFYYRDELKAASLEGKDIIVEINGEIEKTNVPVYVKDENYDTLYFEIAFDSGGHYLVMEKEK